MRREGGREGGVWILVGGEDEKTRVFSVLRRGRAEGGEVGEREETSPAPPWDSEVKHAQKTRRISSSSSSSNNRRSKKQDRATSTSSFSMSNLNLITTHRCFLFSALDMHTDFLGVVLCSLL